MAREDRGAGRGARGSGSCAKPLRGSGREARGLNVLPSLRIAFNWQRHPGGNATGPLRRFATDALRRLGVDAAEVGVLVCDDVAIRSLNRHYRGKDAATDVLSFEGGFYGIAGDDGKHYDPTNLSPEFQKDGLRVRFEAKTLEGMASYHQWGTLVELITIQKL